MSDPPLFSTLSRWPNTLGVAIPYRPTEGLHLLIDSIGIKANGSDANTGLFSSERRILRKIHIAVDEKSLEIRAVEVTYSAIGYAPILPDLLDQFRSQEESIYVTADGACDARRLS